MNKKTFWVLIIFVLLSFIGLADSIYLTYEHYTRTSLVCILGAGCDIVTTSKYSEIFGIYVAVYGIIYYAFIFLLSLILITINYARTRLPARQGANFYKFLIFLTPIGFLASLYFVYLQLFVIKAICFWCIVSAIDSTILFVLGLYLAKNSHNNDPSTKQSA